jgi:hypothetical protein
MTSVANETDSAVGPDQTRRAVVQAFQDVFGLALVEGNIAELFASTGVGE